MEVFVRVLTNSNTPPTRGQSTVAFVLRFLFEQSEKV